MAWGIPGPSSLTSSSTRFSAMRLVFHTDNAASALRFDGMPRIANQVHQDLLELPGIAVDEWEHGIEIEFHAKYSRMRS